MLCVDSIWIVSRLPLPSMPLFGSGRLSVKKRKCSQISFSSRRAPVAQPLGLQDFVADVISHILVWGKARSAGNIQKANTWNNGTALFPLNSQPPIFSN